MIAAEAVARS